MLKALAHTGRWLTILALFVSLGGHLAIMQTIAWANMLEHYSQKHSMEKAMEMTFDGQHPCSLCLEVQKSKKQQKKQEILQMESKLIVNLPKLVRLKALWGTPTRFTISPYQECTLAEVHFNVPLQPPRCA